MKRTGWRGESARHSLAARGCSTRHPVPRAPSKSRAKTFKLYRGVSGSDARQIIKAGGIEDAGSYWTDDPEVAKWYAGGGPGQRRQDDDSWAVICVELPSNEVTNTFRFGHKSKGHWWGEGSFGEGSPPVGKIGAMEWQSKKPVSGVKVCEEGRYE